MRPDIAGLEISKGELKQLIGIAVRDIVAPFPRRVSLLALWYFAIDYVVIGILRLLLEEFTPFYLPATIHLALSLGLGVGTAIYHRLIWRRDAITKSLLNLLEDVERYNAVIRAIHINDQLEEVGNTDVTLQNRRQVIDALKLTREDLVRALKTERILRQNKDFITRNPDLFVNNLSALAALQVRDTASEHGRLLNEALQIAVDAQAELRRLQ